MTFDEVLDELKRETFWSTGFPEIQEIEFEKVKYAVEKLREEYAPTVEMTNRDYSVFIKYKDNGKSYEDLLDCVVGNYFDLEEYNLFPNLTRSNLMSACLHPETIKVVDE